MKVLVELVAVCGGSHEVSEPLAILTTYAMLVLARRTSVLLDTD